ncbi:Glycosyltransferase [Entamoeba marina]
MTPVNKLTFQPSQSTLERNQLEWDLKFKELLSLEKKKDLLNSRQVEFVEQNVKNDPPVFFKGGVKYQQIPPYRSETCPDGIDVVWLWVNGSDPMFIEELEKNGKKGIEKKYRDYNTLFYSIRSVYEFAPYIKNYYIVTMNQIPTFINTSSLEFGDYKLRIVDHKEIFPNGQDLPVFNSNAIEASLHNIKNLSTCFLYLNDDMLLGKKLKPEHFVRNDGKFNIYHNAWCAPEVESTKKSVWHSTITFSNSVINEQFHGREAVKHSYASHHCYFFNRNILQEMENTWPYQFAKTRSRKFREEDDLFIPFLYGAYSFETEKGVYTKESHYLYGLLDADKKNTREILDNYNKKKPQCICLNDGFGDAPEEDIQQEIRTLTDFLDQYYPLPSPFENKK